MYYLVLAIHIVVCLFLIIVILLQSGKAADLAGAFGGMGSQTAFGPRGSATLLSKATTASATIFMVTSLTLSILATRNAGLSTTVLEDQPLKSIPTKTIPVTPQPNSKTIQIPLPPQTKENTGHPVPVTVPAKK
jgi:preprotein translocase subunit SecG